MKAAPWILNQESRLLDASKVSMCAPTATRQGTVSRIAAREASDIRKLALLIRLLVKQIMN